MVVQSSLSFYAVTCLQQKQLQQINKTWTKQARQLQFKEEVNVVELRRLERVFSCARE